MAIREEFVRALSAYPEWAMQRAFDAWVKTGSRRPSPGEIAILAQREIEPMATELRRRTPVQDEAGPERVTKAAADEILARAGFTPARFQAVSRQMMPTPETVQAAVARVPHWSDAIPPGSENDLEAIRMAKINAGVADA